MHSFSFSGLTVTLNTEFIPNVPIGCWITTGVLVWYFLASLFIKLNINKIKLILKENNIPEGDRLISAWFLSPIGFIVYVLCNTAGPLLYILSCGLIKYKYQSLCKVFTWVS